MSLLYRRKKSKLNIHWNVFEQKVHQFRHFSKCHCKTSEISIKENWIFSFYYFLRYKSDISTWKSQSYFEFQILFYYKLQKKIKLFLSDIAKLVKFGLKSALKKICEKELSEGKLFCFRKKAVKLFFIFLKNS